VFEVSDWHLVKQDAKKIKLLKLSNWYSAGSREFLRRNKGDTSEFGAGGGGWTIKRKGGQESFAELPQQEEEKIQPISHRQRVLRDKRIV